VAAGPFVSSGDTDQKHTFPLPCLVRAEELLIQIRADLNLVSVLDLDSNMLRG